MAIVTFDTCIFISHQPTSFPKGFRMSAVVLQELTAGAPDDQIVKVWREVWKEHEKAGTLLVPNGEDWWLAGKVLNSLLRGLKARNKGRTPKLSGDEVHRIVRDVLIARTAKRAGAAVVTDNLKDFDKIKKYCSIRTIGPERFLGK